MEEYAVEASQESGELDRGVSHSSAHLEGKRKNHKYNGTRHIPDMPTIRERPCGNKIGEKEEILQKVNTAQ